MLLVGFFQSFFIKTRYEMLTQATSMLMTDVGDEMCWWQLWDVGDGFGHFCHQHPLSFSINVRHQHSKDVTNIKILSLTSTNCHQDKVTDIYVALTHGERLGFGKWTTVSSHRKYDKNSIFRPLLTQKYFFVIFVINFRNNFDEEKWIFKWRF